MDNHNVFLQAERERVAKLYSKKKHENGFPTKDSFVDWYSDQIQCQNFRCFYCDTSIFDIRSLIDGEKLRTRQTKHGCRGPVLEIDRKENDKGYSPDNCVLACYYCNNDKSYIIDGDDYKIYFGKNRKKYFCTLNNK